MRMGSEFSFDHCPRRRCVIRGRRGKSSGSGEVLRATPGRSKFPQCKLATLTFSRYWPLSPNVYNIPRFTILQVSMSVGLSV
ncbi:hypothetical protein RRG08_049956 [Elysia crispata]|uniref:Uncharacterized protein n=1 Tax=Elysia crispata TaxID=231223 RepID=A0AAE0YU16_9GAST|nr:hypothetical protein RRG08_049956 [Elysia crispata]